MLKYNPKLCLPSSAELPDSNDTPVDSYEVDKNLNFMQKNAEKSVVSAFGEALAFAWGKRGDRAA